MQRNGQKGLWSSIKIYFHDGFKVMPMVQEKDFTFCVKKFEMNYANYINHVDTNRVNIMANPNTRTNKVKRQPPK